MKPIERSIRAALDTNERTGRAVQLFLILLCSIVSLAVAAVQAYGNRDHVFQDDAVSYLDISDAVLHGDWKELANQQFNPLYPLALAAFRILFRPDAYWEPSIVKLTNFAIFVLVLTAFNIFLNTFLKYVRLRSEASQIQIPPSVLILCLYSCFWWTCLSMEAAYIDTPDYFVIASMLSSATIIMNIEIAQSGRVQSALLGCILGLGYLAKAIMFPISAVYILMASVRQGSLNQKIACTLITLACFGIFTLPRVSALSAKVGHLTFSESGRAAYSTTVEGLVHGYIMEGPSYIHPPRVISTHPKAYEFATPIAGTFPLWYDPLYWQQGPSIRFSIGVIDLIGYNACDYAGWFGWIFLLAWLAEYLVSIPLIYPAEGKPSTDPRRFLRYQVRLTSPLKGITSTWRLWLPAAVGLGLYMAVVPVLQYGQGRYIASFVLLLAAARLAALRLDIKPRNKTAIAATLIVLCAYPLFVFSQQVAQSYSSALRTPSYMHWHLAQKLKQLGLREGDRIAILRPGAWQGWDYFARLAHFKIIALIEDQDDKEFLSATEAEREELYRKLASYGVKAIVHESVGKLRKAMPAHWQEVNGQAFYVYLIPGSVK